jgi:hypothetical protein
MFIQTPSPKVGEGDGGEVCKQKVWRGDELTKRDKLGKFRYCFFGEDMNI